MIYRNTNRSGNFSNLMFGFMQAADGIVRIFSLGFFGTPFPIEYARRSAKRQCIAAAKKASECQKS